MLGLSNPELASLMNIDVADIHSYDDNPPSDDNPTDIQVNDQEMEELRKKAVGPELLVNPDKPNNPIYIHSYDNPNNPDYP